MRFGTAIERLVDNYRYAKSKVWIRDEVAWALYKTWKEADERKTEPQYDIDKGTIKCDNCSENGSYKCSKCDGEMYFKRLEVDDEPQTDNGIGCSRCEGGFDCYDRDMPHAVRCNNYGKVTDEPLTERSE